MRAYISLGSNVGDRRMYIEKALQLLRPTAVSPIIETEPIGMEGMFLNAVAEIETQLGPYELLDRLEQIEKKLGRTEKGNYKPRTIDLDILTYGDMVIDTPRLKIPHPRLKERQFLCKLLTQLKEKKVNKR